MAGSFVATGGAQTGSTTCVVTGVTAAVDDWLFIVIHHKATTAPTTPAGWTRVDQSASTSGNLSIYIKKVTSAGAQANVTISGLTSSCVGSMAAFRGLDTTTPYRLTDISSFPVKSQSNAEGTYEVSAFGEKFLAQTGDICLVIAGFDNDGSSTSYVIDGSSVGINEIADGQTTTGTDSALAWAYLIPTGNFNFTDGSLTFTEGSAGTANNVVEIMCLKPAPTGTAIGKDLGLLWNVAQPPIGKNLQLIWNTKATIAKSLQFIWLVLTPITKTLQLIWNIKSALGKEYAYLWNLRFALGKNNQLVWNANSTLGKNNQLIWNDLTSTNKTLQSIWNIRALLGKNSQTIWNVRALVNLDVQLIWNVLVTTSSAIGQTLQLIWSINTPVGASSQLIWHIRAALGKEYGYYWNIRQIVGDIGVTNLITPSFNATFDTDVNGWNVSGNITKTWDAGALKITRITTNGFAVVVGDQHSGDVPYTQPKIHIRFKARSSTATMPFYFAVYDTNNQGFVLENFVIDNVMRQYTFTVDWSTKAWDVRNFEFGSDVSILVGDSYWIDDIEVYAVDSTDLTLRYNVRKAITKSLDIQWNALTVVNKSNQLIWNVRAALGKEYGYYWNIFTPVGNAVQFIWSLTAVVGKSGQFIWNTLSNAIVVGQNLQTIWNTRATSGKNLQQIWNVLTSVGKNSQFIWNIRTFIGKSLQIIWTTFTKTGGSFRQFLWSIRAVLSKDNQLVWNTNTKTTKDLSTVWNVLTVVPGNSRQLIWNTRSNSGKDLQLIWNTIFVVHWTPVPTDPGIWTPVGIDSEAWTPASINGSIWTPVVQDTEIYTPVPTQSTAWT